MLHYLGIIFSKNCESNPHLETFMEAIEQQILKDFIIHNDFSPAIKISQLITLLNNAITTLEVQFINNHVEDISLNKIEYTDLMTVELPTINDVGKLILNHMLFQPGGILCPTDFSYGT